MSADDTQPDAPEDWIEYQVTSEFYDPPEEHEETGRGTYLCPPDFDVDDLEERGLIDVAGGAEELVADGEFHGGPELIQTRDDVYKIAVPTEERNSIRAVGLSEWYCERCGHEIDMGDVTTEEDITEPEECPGCEREGPFSHSATQYAATQSEIEPLLTTGPIWEMPNGVGDADFGDVWDRVYEYIHTHWDAGDNEWLYEGLTAYAVSSWFRPDFDFVPHILVMGAHETGKTRLLNTLQEVCYRAVHTASTSPASIYRSIDNSNVTFFLSEYHDIGDDVQQVVDSVLKMGQKRGEVALRAEEQRGGGYDVSDFSPFTHVAIATQFEPRDDIMSRCFTITTQPATRDVPWRLHDASDLRADLLGLRYDYLNSRAMEEAQERVEERLSGKGVTGREGEKMWGLMTVAELADRDITDFLEHVAERDRKDKLDSEEAYFVQCVIDEAFTQLAEVDSDAEDPWPDLYLKLADITDRFNNMTDRDVETRYVGTLRKRVGIGKHRRQDGTYIRDAELKDRLKTLAQQYGVGFEPSEGVGPDTREYAEVSQGERREAIRSVVNRKHGVDAVPIDSVVGELVKDGFDESQVRHDIEKMLEAGDLMEPAEGKLQLGS